MSTLKLYLVQESDPVLFGIMMTAVLDRAPTPVLEAVHEFANFVKYGGLQSSQFPAFVQFLRDRRPCVRAITL